MSQLDLDLSLGKRRSLQAQKIGIIIWCLAGQKWPITSKSKINKKKKIPKK